MENSLKGKRIVVTGAGQGIGRDVCLCLHKYGAKVVGISKTLSNLESLKKEIPDMETVCVNLANWDETRKAVEKITNKPIHGLVNNAAMASLEPFIDCSPENFDIAFNVNVKAVINVSQVVAKNMIANKKGGSIVNISSQASKAALLDHSIYCATKGALDSLSRVMALELGKFNIRVNCVNPTVVLTEMGRLGWSDPVKAKNMIDKIPLGRFAEMGEVTNCIIFLLSDVSSMVNGIEMPIDGGFLAC